MSEIHISNYWTNYVREKMDMVTVDVLDIAQAFNERNSSPVQRGALANLHSLVYKKELKMRNLLTLKKLCMKSIMENFNVEPSPLNISCSDISDAMLPSALREEFLQFLTGQEYFHELRWNIAHLGILLVNSNTTCLDVRRLFETDRIDADVEQRVVEKLKETAWKLKVLVVENLPDVLLQPLQPIATLRHLEIWGTELTDSHIGMIARNAPNLVILKVCLDINLATVNSLVHLQWLRCLEEFVVLRSSADKYFHFLRRILHFMPQLKVAGAKADHYDAIQHYHEVLTHYVPVGHTKLPLEHLFVGSEIMSRSQAEMLPKLKAFCVDLVDFDIRPVPDALLKFPELESLSLNHPPPDSSALMFLLQAYGKRLKKLTIDSSMVSIDVMETMTLCPLLEKLHVHCIALDQSSLNPNLGVMSSLVSVNIFAWRDQEELPRKLFPRIMASPHLHDIALKCNYINLEDVRLVRKMAEAGDLKKLEYFHLQLHKPLSELEKLDYELMTYSVFAFSPAFKYRDKCCTLYIIP